MGKLIPFLTLFFYGSVFAKNLDFTVPVRPVSMSISQPIYLSGKIEPREYAEIMADWPTLISAIKIKKDQKVQKGQILAEVDNRESKFFLNYYKAFYSDMTQQIDRLTADLKFLEKRQGKLRDLAAKGIIPVTEAEKTEKSILDARKAQLTSVHQMKAIRSEIEAREKQMEMTNLTAPFDGVVDYLIVDPKQLVGAFILDARVPFAIITKPNLYRVKAMVFDTDVAFIQEKQACKISWNSIEKPLNCSISAINPYVKQQNENSYRPQKDSESKSLPQYFVTVIFEHNQPIPSGMIAKVELNRNTSEKGLAIPWNAVKVSADSTTVKVFDQEKGFEERPVSLGARNDNYVIIRNGLQPSDVIYARLD